MELHAYKCVRLQMKMIGKTIVCVSRSTYYMVRLTYKCVCPLKNMVGLTSVYVP